MVPVAAIAAAFVSGWVVKLAVMWFADGFSTAPGSPGDLFWNLILAPGLDSAVLAWAFVGAGRWMAPKAKIRTAAALSYAIVGSFALVTLMVWLLEPTSVRANLQASLGCVAAYMGTRVAAGGY